MKAAVIGKTVGVVAALGLTAVVAYTIYDLYKIHKILEKADEDPIQPMDEGTLNGSFFPEDPMEEIADEENAETVTLPRYYRSCRKSYRASLRKGAARHPIY